MKQMKTAILLTLLLTGCFAYSQQYTAPNYYETVQYYKNSGKTNIAVYKPQSKNESQIPEIYQPLVEELAQNGKNAVKIVSEEYLTSYEGMDTKLLDILVIMEPSRLTDRHFILIKNYLNKGGSLIISSNDFFGHEPPAFRPAPALVGEDYFRNTTAYLGIKPYTGDIVPQKASFDNDFFPTLPNNTDIVLPPEGIYANTGSEKLHPGGYFGSVTPERYPVLRNYVVVEGTDPMGKTLNSSVVFTQNWENKSRMVLIASNSESSLISPANKYFPSLIDAAIKHCQNRVFVTDIAPDYACYRKGEKVTISYTGQNFSASEKKINVEIKLQNNNTFAKEWIEELTIKPESFFTGKIEWKVPSDAVDYYHVEVKLKENKQVISKANNGFVVWLDNTIKNAPAISIEGNEFLIDGKPAVLTGTNYYESELGDLMWIKPNVKKLHDDFQQMANSHINFIRIHYHHAKWYHDYFIAMHGVVPEYFKDVHDGYMPDEKILRNIDAHIYLCQKFGIVFGGDLLSLVPREMGDPRGWMTSFMHEGIQDQALFPEKREKQKEFLRLIANRYKEVPLIAWDLWNEPHIHNDSLLRDWALEMRNAMRKAGDKHPLTVGKHNSLSTKDAVDYYSVHDKFDNRYSNLSKIPDASKPVIFQEVWMDTPQNFSGDSLQLEQMKQALLTAFNMGMSGFAPWQWTSQAKARNDYSSGYLEDWDDKLGACVRSDGSLKPAGRYYKHFSWMVEKTPFYDVVNGTGKTAKGRVEISYPEKQDKGTFLLKYTTNGNITAGIVKSELTIDGRKLIEAENNVDVWFFFENEAGIINADTLYFRLNNKSSISCDFGKKPKSVFLVEVPGSEKISELEYEFENNKLIIHTEKWHCNYWIGVGLK